MLSAAYGLERPPARRPRALDLRAYERLDAAARRARGLERARRARCPRRRRGRARAHAIRARAGPRPAASPSSTSCARARAASRSCSCSAWRRGACRAVASDSPFLDDDRAGRARRARLRGPTRSRATATSSTRPARARRGGSTSCARRPTDDGSPREPSPFWEEVARPLRPPTTSRAGRRRRPLSALTWPIEDAPTERERLRALAALAAADDRGRAEALARANGWERRLERALRRLRPADAPDASARARAARLEAHVQRDRARALRRLLVRAGSSTG